MAEQDLKKQIAALFDDLTLDEAEPSDDTLAQIFSDIPTPDLENPHPIEPIEPEIATEPEKHDKIEPRLVEEPPQASVPTPTLPDTRPIPPEPPLIPAVVPPPSPIESLPPEPPPVPAAVPPPPPTPVEPAPSKQSLWANDPLLRMAADENKAVAKLALETLLKMGDVVRERVLGLAQQPTAPLHAGVEAYLSLALDQPMIYIRPGQFMMGSDRQTDPLADPHEEPAHSLSLPGYWLARYSVTVAQFQRFLAKSGYQPSGKHTAAGADNKPVIDVTWHDALAYCRWLSDKSHLPLTLPSEAQWEKAARGESGQRYPWGNVLPTTYLCSLDRAAVGQCSPQGDSPYGCSDMAGNVWEWTRSGYRSYPYARNDGREETTTQEARVVRGVAFGDVEQVARCAYRYPLKQNMHLLTLGFRVVIDPNSG